MHVIYYLQRPPSPHTLAALGKRLVLGKLTHGRGNESMTALRDTGVPLSSLPFVPCLASRTSSKALMGLRRLFTETAHGAWKFHERQLDYKKQWAFPLRIKEINVSVFFPPVLHAINQ